MLRDTKEIRNDPSWRRINMRNVGHLIGVEFIHDLYNRHRSRINYIRFRNTITTWKDGVVESYAPVEEWTYLEKWFGEKFYTLNPVTLKGFKKLLRTKRRFFNWQLERFARVDLKKLNGIELGVHLIEVHEYSFGGLYRMNFVQAEYALTYAIKRILREIIPEEEVNNTFSKLIVAKKLTEAQKEERAFQKILRNKKTIEDPITDKVSVRIQKHWDKYAYMHSAYGEDPYSMEYYIRKYKSFDPADFNKLPNYKFELDKYYKEGRKLLKKIKNSRLDVLIPLMIDGGTFRDKNKAKLGYTIRFKHNILNEISERKLEDRNKLNYYLISEILRLLTTGEKVDGKVLSNRKTNGVVLRRQEFLSTDTTSVKEIIQKKEIALLRGVCASPGLVQGHVKVVITKKDAHKVERGDIMVAIGTDFDLMDAIYRSSAVITEEGGLLSHASVVCREMKKPCYIGVQNVTKTLSDGDYIKLDTDSGISKI